ncbi:MAG: hypothetical protein HQL24_07275 [Candidatus Omnitrophica bacterium]|nr:hypothetical protein [Candidatus Omnitrophota bacterium]
MIFKKKNKRALVITGLGPICSTGIGKKHFWQGILNRKTNIVERSYFFKKHTKNKFFVHEVRDFSIKDFNIDRNKLNELYAWRDKNELSKDVSYLLASIQLAIQDGDLSYKKDKNNIGLVVFHENLGLGPFYDEIVKLIRENQKLFSNKNFQDSDIVPLIYFGLKKSGYNLQNFVSLHEIARIFNLHGFTLFINNACCSGLYALEVAADIIRSGKSKSVLIAGSDSGDIYKHLWFNDLGLYSPDGVIRPFAENRNGFIFGESGGAMLMEDYEHAKQRGANIYAEYCGGSFLSESWKINHPAIAENYYSQVIEGALQRSKIKVSDIDLICPHGTGTIVFDIYEAMNIKKVFGEKFPKPYITALKPYFGHCLGNSAFLESIAALLVLKNNVIPPTLNIPENDDTFGLRVIRDKVPTNINYVIKTCSAFAGFDGAVIFKKV